MLIDYKSVDYQSISDLSAVTVLGSFPGGASEPLTQLVTSTVRSRSDHGPITAVTVCSRRSRHDHGMITVKIRPERGLQRQPGDRRHHRPAAAARAGGARPAARPGRPPAPLSPAAAAAAAGRAPAAAGPAAAAAAGGGCGGGVAAFGGGGRAVGAGSGAALEGHGGHDRGGPVAVLAVKKKGSKVVGSGHVIWSKMFYIGQMMRQCIGPLLLTGRKARIRI
jgi:hypothetical protein